MLVIVSDADVTMLAMMVVIVSDADDGGDRQHWRCDAGGDDDNNHGVK